MFNLYSLFVYLLINLFDFAIVFIFVSMSVFSFKISSLSKSISISDAAVCCLDVATFNLVVGANFRDLGVGFGTFVEFDVDVESSVEDKINLYLEEIFWTNYHGGSIDFWIPVLTATKQKLTPRNSISTT